MDEFSDTISWLKNRKEIAQGDLKELNSGKRYFINGNDITATMRQRTEMDVSKLDDLIAAFESYRYNDAQA
ncbi:hypothetical protein [Mesorhizobium sp. IMUNJ 23232]|uniref:hypothetical protein n=1 Tax=Mesorhizobium sp. IMUNJ 23232 TaxID=3376064 RepID=UPI0037A7D573